jgi:hypothetical protein
LTSVGRSDRLIKRADASTVAQHLKDALERSLEARTSVEIMRPNLSPRKCWGVWIDVRTGFGMQRRSLQATYWFDDSSGQHIDVTVVMDHELIVVDSVSSVRRVSSVVFKDFMDHHVHRIDQASTTEEGTVRITRKQLRHVIREEARRLNEYGADSHQLIIDKLGGALDELSAASELANGGALEPGDARELETIVNRLLAFTQKFD